jgi:hypothetical protein
MKLTRPKLTYAEFIEHIEDQFTRIALEKTQGKLTEKQFGKELFDLAKWAMDRMQYLSLAEQIKFSQSQVSEAFKRRVE